MGMEAPVAEVAGAGIAGAGDFISTIAHNRTQKKIARETNANNLQIARENNQTQIDMARENNQFAHDEAELAYQREIEQYNRENEYNSPLNVMNRYLEAGINPQLAMQNGESVMASGSSQPQATPHGSGISPSMPNLVTPNLQTFQPGQAFANVFAALSQGFKDISDADKAGTEAEQLRKMFNDTLKGIQQDNVRKEIENYFLPFVMNGQIERNFAEVASLWNQALVYQSQGELNKAETSLRNAQELTEHWRSEEQKVVAQTTNDRILQEIKESRSRESANYASAEASRAAAALSRKEEEVKASEILNNEKVREKYAQEITNMIEQNEGVKLSNARRMRLSSYIDNLIITGANQAEQDYWNPFRYVGTLLGGAAAPVLKELLK